MTDKEVMQMALDALDYVGYVYTTEEENKEVKQAIEALRTALAQPDMQIGITYEEANPPQPYCERCGKKLGSEVTDIHTCTPKEIVAWEALVESVRLMRDVQGMDGNWNYDPYMQGLFNGIEFSLSLLEVREPQFRDAPKKWLCDEPKARICSGEKNT